jgi:hypothetical protein
MRSWQFVPPVHKCFYHAVLFTSLILISLRLVRKLSSVLLAALLFISTIPAWGDTLHLTPKGVAGLQGRGLAVLSADGKTYVVHGQFVVLRDETDQLTLKYPGKYFLFRPFKKGLAGPAKVEQFEWAWVAWSKTDIDTLEDLRDLISNRDKRHGGWQQGLEAFLADLDPQASLGLKKGPAPPVANTKIVLREGWLTRNFLQGMPTPDQLLEMIRAARALPPEDPLSSTRIPLTQSQPPDALVGSLVDAIARAQKYGEPEPGFLPAALTIARFLIGSLNTNPDKAKGDDEEKAKRIWPFVRNFTDTLLASVNACSPERLAGGQNPMDSAENLSKRLKLPGNPDDGRPIDCVDFALAGVNALGGSQVSRPEDAGQTVETLLHGAEGRRDLLGPQMRATFPPDLQARLDSIGKLAFETLVRIAAPAAAGQPDLGARFRAEIPVHVFEQLVDVQNASSPYRKAPSAVLFQVGAGNAEEASTLADFFLNPFTRSGSSGGVSCDSEKIDLGIDTIKGIMKGTKSPTIRVIFERKVELKIKSYQDRVRVGSAGFCEDFLVEHWKSRP